MKIIVISGPSGSGKTHLSYRLLEIFENSILIQTDSYYRDNILIRILSIFKNDIYDRPLSIKKNKIKNTINSIYNKDKIINCFDYDFIKKKSSELSVIINYNCKKQFIILEGIFSHCLDLNYQDTINIVCKEDKEKCFKRRLVRDQLYRGRYIVEIKKRFNKSWNLFYKSIKKFINMYDVITVVPSDKNSYENLINNLKLIKK